MVLITFAKCVIIYCLPGKIAALFTLLWKGEKKTKKQDGDLRGQKTNPWLVVLLVTSKKQQACLCHVMQRADFFLFIFLALALLKSGVTSFPGSGLITDENKIIMKYFLYNMELLVLLGNLFLVMVGANTWSEK